MRLVITITTDKPIPADDLQAALANMLGGLAWTLEHKAADMSALPLHDVKGERIGQARIYSELSG